MSEFYCLIVINRQQSKNKQHGFAKRHKPPYKVTLIRHTIIDQKLNFILSHEIAHRLLDHLAVHLRLEHCFD